MEDTYTIMRVFAGSWGMMFMLLSFLGVILFTLRPGSRQVHRDTANIPFRYDDRPAGDDEPARPAIQGGAAMSEDKNKHPEEQILQEGDPDTTGHSWDGIKEFNNPLPRWWLWTFYATIVWGIGYTVLYPAWPLVEGATPGILGFSTRANVAEDIQEFDAMNADVRTRIAEVELAAINPNDNPDLYNYAIQGGASTFADMVFAVSRVRCGGRSGLGLSEPAGR
jgi:cbb3-type cytochrome oxidase subunit 3